jgi:anaerobic selenocysteine-containing dehydrogenase
MTAAGFKPPRQDRTLFIHFGKLGWTRCLILWSPPGPVTTPELYEKYPLIMITGARSQLYFHSEHRMIPWLREKQPDPCVEIHPDTAAKYGIYDGEWIHIVNDLGKVKRKARLTLTVRPNQIQTQHGWWLRS